MSSSVVDCRPSAEHQDWPSPYDHCSAPSPPRPPSGLTKISSSGSCALPPDSVTRAPPRAIPITGRVRRPDLAQSSANFPLSLSGLLSSLPERRLIILYNPPF